MTAPVASDPLRADFRTSEIAANRATIREQQAELSQLRSDLAHAHDRIAVLQETLLARTATLHLLEAKLRGEL